MSYQRGVDVRDAELTFFCKELAIFIRTGMTLEEVIEFMEQDSEDYYIKHIIKEVKKGLAAGKPIEKAMQATQEFPDYMIYMIKIGLKLDCLEEILKQLVCVYEEKIMLKKNLKHVIKYPIYLSSIMCMIMLLLVVKVIPTFNKIFLNWNGELTESTKFFMGLSKLMGICTSVLFVCVMTLSIIGLILFKTKKGRKLGKCIIGYTNIVEKMNVANFTWVMGFMLKRGLSVEQSLKESLIIIESKSVKQRVNDCLNMMTKDKMKFEDALLESKIFSRKTTKLIINGYRKKDLQGIMSKVGEACRKDVAYTFKNKILGIQTISVGVTSVIIGSILMTIILPLMSILMALD